MTTTAEIALKSISAASMPVEVPASNPKVAQIGAMLGKLGDRELTLAAALIAQLVKFSEKGVE